MAANLGDLVSHSQFGITISAILAKFGNTMPTPQELATMCGFSEIRVARLGLMWDVAFNNKWILVTKEMINVELGADSGKDTMSDFYKNVLSKLRVDVDYKQVGDDDESVKNYESDHSGPAPNKRRGGRARKHYMITGRVYKRLLMKASTKAGSDQCDYYCDVEMLGLFYQKCAAAMYQTLAELAQRESQQKDVRINEQLLMIEEKDVAIEGAQRELAENKEAVAYLQQKVITAETITPDQYIYIGTCNALAEAGVFKVGGVGSHDDLAGRLEQYQTPHSVNDPFMFPYIAAVSDFLHVEKRISQAIGKYRENTKTNKETYKIPYEYLVRRVDAIVKGFAAENDAANADRELLVQGMTKRPTYVPVAAPWPAPPANYQPKERARPRRRRGPQEVKQEPAAPEDPIKTIINTGIDNLTDEQKQELVRQLLIRVAPDADPEVPRAIPSSDFKKAMTDAMANKKFGIRSWAQVVKPIIAQTRIRMTGRW